MKHELQMDPDKETQGEEAKKRLARSLGLSGDATQEDLLKAVGGEEKALLDAIGDEEIKSRMPREEEIREYTSVPDEARKKKHENRGSLQETLHAAGISFEREKFDVYYRDVNGETLAKFIDGVGRPFYRTKEKCEALLADLKESMMDSDADGDTGKDCEAEYKMMEKIIKEWPPSRVLNKDFFQ